MNNETKRDVFEDAAFNIETSAPDGPKFADELRQRYAAALPDDLPVIPKAVGRMITKMKPTCNSILASQYRDYGKDHRWIIHHYDTFARAWLLEAWIVEETGKIVKVEDGE